MTEKTVRLSKPALSFQYTPKHLLISVLALLCGVFVVLLSLSQGSQNVSIAQVIMTLLSPEMSEHVFTIYHLRLPRTLIAMFAGAALAVSGLILQKVIRNPLASPDIIGVTSGASFSAVLFISTLAGSISVHWLPSVAIVGAFMASILIYVLAWHRGITPLRFVLIGLGIAATLNAFTTVIVVMSPNAVRLEAIYG
ncbi:iron chelate uptake ABC transporter family permease subunit [Vibrio sonorensis]|uniref:iron chelate uptake ABC transporter family permease subunit n=1 Tax=Vibrio sonorensis TaxID=1004316 RepID=UPI001C2F3A35|nr:iron chelate uptake ABC transporter family permease subunit [Vibrio sonorensis]